MEFIDPDTTPHPIENYESAVLGDGHHAIIQTNSVVCLLHQSIKIYSRGVQANGRGIHGAEFFHYQRWDAGGCYLNPYEMSEEEFLNGYCPYSD